MKYKLILIGNAPSSGSSFLGDLLDSTPFSVCGPELNLFSIRPLYELFKNHIKISSVLRLSDLVPSLYAVRNRLFIHNLSAYGLDDVMLTKMINDSSSFHEFVENFGLWFTSLRGEDERFLIFEKTPQNIYAIRSFLEIYDSYFVIIVRNPIFTVYSLWRRGFTPFQAMFTPLIDLSVIFSLDKEKDRVIIVKYEDLVKNPFGEVQRILSLVSSIQYDDRRDFQERFKNNKYRAIHDRKRGELFNRIWLESWTESRAGVITNANQRPLPKFVLLMFKEAMHFRINPSFSELFGLSPVSYLEVLDYLGYKSEVFALMKSVSEAQPLSYTRQDVIFLAKKLAFSLMCCKQPIKLFSITRPVMPVDKEDLYVYL